MIAERLTLDYFQTLQTLIFLVIFFVWINLQECRVYIHGTYIIDKLKKRQISLNKLKRYIFHRLWVTNPSQMRCPLEFKKKLIPKVWHTFGNKIYTLTLNTRCTLSIQLQIPRILIDYDSYAVGFVSFSSYFSFPTSSPEQSRSWHQYSPILHWAGGGCCSLFPPCTNSAQL